MAGVYVHIPFCVKKCDYCDFVSFPEDGRLAGYVDSLRREILLTAEALPSPGRIDTVFLGGGTPSLLATGQLGAILDTVADRYDVAADAEISMEVNPGTVTAESLAGYRRAGVNRLSIGAQSTDNALLRAIGRIHTRLQILDAVRFAHKAGFDNINLDVMHGLPGQTEAQYLATLTDAVSLDVTHLSSYALILEEGTPLFSRVKKGETALPDGDAVADMEDAGLRFLAESRFARYEISNFAQPGFACRHNLNYWRNGEYLGFGLAAHSAMRLGAWTRWSNTERLSEYLEKVGKGKRPLAETLRLEAAEEMFECVMLGLRLVAGLDRAAFYERFGVPVETAYPDAVAALRARGWTRETETHFALNDTGLDLQNAALQLFF